MKKYFAAVILFFAVNQTILAQIELRTERLWITISRNGHFSRLFDPVSNREYLAKGTNAPLLKIRTGKDWENPDRAVFNSGAGIITLKYNRSGINADIMVSEKGDHLAFRLNTLNRKNKVNAVCWGAYPVSIGKVIGEVVGVVRDGEFAIGIQALNAKTIGGVLKSEGGLDDSRGSAAVAQPYGSSLQAYSLDRSHPRQQTVWGNQYPDMPVRAIPGETAIGSAIALFGCPEDQVLKTIGSIERTWGLPQPLINGVWHKQSPETGRAYIISDFTEENIDEMLEFTNKAGLTSLYHEGPFQSWGHFILDSLSFPHGREGMKMCVDQAAKLGIRIGAHTLSTFINTNDPYVTPVPDPRLSATGSSFLTSGTDETDTTIGVECIKYFSNLKSSTLHAVRIGKEIIQIREVTLSPPYQLLGCRRGAFGTKASAHIKGEEAFMLMDYPYHTLFPEFSLQQEIAGNLAGFFNETGVSQMDFDGHEGCMSSGEGEYAMQAFAEKVYRETNHTLVNGTSRSSHFYWHICHYWNWGEPWYGGFRESQGDYRLENQPFLERNYMPNMLGWFLLSSTTSPEDIEWMMARAAGYKAGFALVARYKSLKENPESDRLLELIRLWQEASRSGIFSPDQLRRLKDASNDFHLEKSAENWKLYPFLKHRFEVEEQVDTIGKLYTVSREFENPDPAQPLRFTLTFGGTSVIAIDPEILLDESTPLIFKGEITSGCSLVCDGKTIKLYDPKGKFIRNSEPVHNIPVISGGKHGVKVRLTTPETGHLVYRLVISTVSGPEMTGR